MWQVPDRVAQIVRSGGAAVQPVMSAYVAGQLVAGPEELTVEDGSVDDDVTAPGERRVCREQLTRRRGLADLLAAPGTRLAPSWVIDQGGGVVDTIPLGVFEPDEETLSYEPGGALALTAPDLYRKVQLARFLVPQASTPGLTVAGQIIALLRGALGTDAPVNNLTTSSAVVGPLTWDRDRDKAIEELAASIGAAVFFDRSGVATIADLPTTGVAPVWTVDASVNGVLLGADRSRSRTETRNVVVVNSEKVDGSVPFEPVMVWDQDSSSPTYAGVDPLRQPGTAGPFGIAPDFYSSPLLTSVEQAERAGLAILAKKKGQAKTLSVSAAPHHGLDGYDPIDVLLPSEVDGGPRVSERHLVDRVTHPLTVDKPQSIGCRSISQVQS